MSSKPKPNLFIIGAMKSGTTALHTYMGEHPAIFMCEPKEPEHFGRWLIPYDGQDPRLKDESEYLQLYEAAGEARFLGESSTSYTKLPNYVGAAESIATFNPEARLIYIMRDPVERVISHYWHMVSHGVETRGIEESVREAAEGAVKTAPQYMSISHYAMQLEPYLERFDRDQLRALTLEELQADPVGVMQGLFDWLGVDPAFAPPSIDRKIHATPAVVRPKRHMGRIRNALRPLIPRPLRRLGSRMYQGAPSLSRPIDRKSVSLEGVEDLLRPLQQEQTRDLSRILGREFPEWTTLYGSR